MAKPDKKSYFPKPSGYFGLNLEAAEYAPAIHYSVGQHLLRFFRIMVATVLAITVSVIALIALFYAFHSADVASFVMAKDCYKEDKSGKCIGIDWSIATPAEVANVNVNARDEYDNTPLHWAAAYNKSPDVIEALIRKGADVNARNEWGRAACWKNFSCFMQAVGVIENKWGDTPLHLAVANNKSPDVTDVLIRNGANVSAKNEWIETPLHQARTADIADILIKNGADVNARNKWGATPLHQAYTADIANLLLKKDANVNARGGNAVISEATPLHWARTADIAELLIKKGADINDQDSDGDTPLHIFVTSADQEIVNLLIRSGADVNARNEKGYTPLHFAAQHKNIEVAGELIKNGADINVRDEGGNTPLHFVLLFDTASFWEVGGADTSIPIVSYRPSGRSATKRFVKVLEVVKLGEADDSNEFSEEAITEKIADLLIRNGANVNVKNKEGNTPLHLAANNGNIVVADMLIENGADVNAKGNGDATPIFWAVYKEGNLKVADMLIQKNANVNSQSKSGWTPLHFATHYNTQIAVSVLLESGADPSIKNEEGKTALEVGKENEDFYKSDVYWLLNDKTYSQKNQ